MTDTPSLGMNEVEFTLEGAPAVEHLSVLGFLRRVPTDQPLGIYNMVKFGNLAANMSRAFGVPYQATLDRTLGVVQTHPEPVLMHAYRYLAPTLQWPRVVDVASLRPREPMAREEQVMTPAAELEVRRTMASQLRAWATHALESDIRSAARVILAVLDSECSALERQLAADEARR